MSTELIYAGICNVISRRLDSVGQNGDGNTLLHLDVGAGQGQLISRMRDRFPFTSHACDYHADRFNVADIEILEVNLNKDTLPYPDSHFDLITCSEVVEHLDNYRRLLAEMHRVAKPGALVIITTPNVINLKSRVKNLWSGFPNLFGPLPIKRDEFYSCGGHISQIPFFYLAQALYEHDFKNVTLDTDKRQNSSVVLFCLLYPLLWIGWKRFLSRETNRYKTIDSNNNAIVLKNFSKEILFGRTIIVSAQKR